MKNIANLLILLTCCLSCRKEQDYYEQTKQHLRENIQFDCETPMGESFFSGKVNGQDFCVSDKVENYWMSNSIYTSTQTSAQNPTTTIGQNYSTVGYSLGFFPPIKDNYNGIRKEFAPFVVIYSTSVIDTNLVKPSEFIERFFQVGDLTLRKEFIDSNSGYYFGIGWSCVLLPGYQHYASTSPTAIPQVTEYLTPCNGPQDNATFKVVEFNKTVKQDKIIYDITIEISCLLYYGSSNTDKTYYGTLEDGVFKTQIVLSPNE